jgi:hypothetical protein
MIHGISQNDSSENPSSPDPHQGGEMNIEILGSKELLTAVLRIVLSPGIAVPTVLLYLRWRRQELEER